MNGVIYSAASCLVLVLDLIRHMEVYIYFKKSQNFFFHLKSIHSSISLQMLLQGVVMSSSSKAESAVIIRLMAALCSDKPVRGRWPPACVGFVTALPRHTAPTHPQMEIESPMPQTVCDTVEHLSKALTGLSDQH